MEYTFCWQSFVGTSVAKTEAGAAEIGWEILRDAMAGGPANAFEIRSDDGRLWIFEFRPGTSGVPKLLRGETRDDATKKRPTRSDYLVHWVFPMDNALSARDAANAGAGVAADALSGGPASILIVEDYTGLKTPFDLADGKARRAGASYRSR
jgi:hypothetical protein